MSCGNSGAIFAPDGNKICQLSFYIDRVMPQRNHPQLLPLSLGPERESTVFGWHYLGDRRHGRGKRTAIGLGITAAIDRYQTSGSRPKIADWGDYFDRQSNHLLRSCSDSAGAGDRLDVPH